MGPSSSLKLLFNNDFQDIMRNGDGYGILTTGKSFPIREQASFQIYCTNNNCFCMYCQRAPVLFWQLQEQILILPHN